MLASKSMLITGGTGSYGETFSKMALEKINPNKIIIFSKDEMKERWPQLSVQPNPIYKWIPCQLGRDALRQFIKVNAVRCHPVKS